MMNTDRYDLLVFGGTRNTGLSIATQAREKNWSVAAMVREGSEQQALQKIGVDICQGDAFQLNDCLNSLHKTQPRMVVSTLGGKNKEGRRIDAVGNINLIHALQAVSSVERFVLMTSMGSGEQYQQSSEQAKKFLGEALLAKTEAEELLKKTILPWTILRPCGLNNEPPTGRYYLLDSPSQRHSNYLSRTDVAAAVLKILEEDQWRHRVLTLQGEVKTELLS